MLDNQLLEHLLSFLTDRRKNLFDEVISKRTRHFTVATEDVYQLHNTSAVMRSCDVFGVQDLHVIEEKVSKKIDREIAMGAQKWVNVDRHNSTKECIDNLKENGYQIIATTPHNNSNELKDFDISKKSAFFFGKEKEGLSDIVLEAADGYLKIPMYGFTESLNISVSAAIILQTLITRLKDSNVDWELSEPEKNEIKLDWAKKSVKSSIKIIKRYKNKIK
ncbi:MAG: RNA methyltransferase [Flavobacteriaceae bacterium]|nr:RNA methyltransferase [Flavobacteriaceae bacterium]MBT3919680.1 RNA methyltransferase [Flavobacteriaceae bacterium]MBT6704682.1 RNA methyltransferase [Flavobacteriaceae bacterium]MBT7242048.1 RNA methyltransferase [Flavobacteriaceae bacterium]